MTKFDELVAKLKEIFQIDKPELDFGIYKVINAKAEMIQKFLTNDLKQKVQTALADKAAAGKKALEDKIAKIEATLAPLGVPPSSSPEWVAAKAELDKLAAADDSESLVYAHLLTFFSRYYDEGDFISKRRYKEGQYAIPYSGEEVKLHWANADQYYTKSGENFTNYDFTVGGKKVHFKLVKAAVAKDNVKDNDCVRCFVLWDPATAPKEGEDGYDENLPTKFLEVKDGELFIYFQYRKFAKGTKQKDFADAAYKAIEQKMTADGLQMEYPIFTEVPTAADKHRTVLAREFTRYMAKNTSDYFIHKNLRKFLVQEMDNYVKTEMMNLDDIANAATFDAIAGNLRLIQTFRLIAMELIGFMAQLEDFQKKLWLKKKFVVQCDYCITIGMLEKQAAELKSTGKAEDAQEAQRIEALVAEAKAKPEQLAEWQRLATDQAPTLPEGVLPGMANAPLDGRMIDTKFFDEDFKARLLKLLPNLDEQCGGLLIHSDNFHGINELQNRYNGCLDSIYIDPPYNTSENTFVYKNQYKHSSWLSMIESRIELSKKLLVRGGVIEVAIDDTETAFLRSVLDRTFMADNRVATISVEVNPAGQNIRPNTPALSHDYCHIYSTHIDSMQMALRSLTSEEVASYSETDSKGRYLWDNLRRRGGNSRPADRPGQWFPLYVKGTSVRLPNMSWDAELRKWNVDEALGEGEIEIWPNDPKGEARIWRVNPDGFKKFNAAGEISVTTKNGRLEIIKKSYMPEGKKPKTHWSDSKYSATSFGSKLLIDMFKRPDFSYPKSLYLVEDCIRFWMKSNSTVLDYFGGSGTTAHAVIALNREDAERNNGELGKRKYILVEMGDHFDTVLKPRIEKVVYSPDWKDGKPTATDKGISHCFKYMTLESYEDTLNNLKLEKPGELFNLGNEYMLNYMLDVESRKSLLGLDKFAHPFDYTLELAVDSSGATKPQKVDMVETFNYLIGLRVDLIDRNISRGYVLAEGKLPSGEEALVLWRDLGKVDNAELRKILDRKGIHPRETGFVLYVNGDHDLPNTVKEENEEKTIKIRSIEAEFNRFMFEEA